jgi:tRNA(Ile)-lysidine synthase
MQNSDFFKKFLKNIKNNFPFLKNEQILLACSGGIDSMSMLHLFVELKKYLSIDIFVCSVNHKLRKKALKEINFVKKECEQLGIDFFALEFDDNFWDKGKKNLEERAREERYRLIFNLANKNSIKYVATAHHKDDLIETLMMRIFERGTGIEGLKGILPISKNNNITILRPLLDFEKKEITEFMSNKSYVEDESNKDICFTRNKFRHIILPKLESIFGENFKNNLVRLSKATNNEMIFSKELALNFWKSKKNDKGYLLLREEIKSYSYEFWITAFSKLFQEYRGFSHSQKALKDIVSFIFKKDPKESNYHPFKIKRDKKSVQILFENKKK